jgi:hypothetical protein
MEDHIERPRWRVNYISISVAFLGAVLDLGLLLLLITLGVHPS